MKEIRLFFKFNFWAWIILGLYIPVCICALLLLSYIMPIYFAISILLIPTAIDFYQAGKIFHNYPYRLKQLNKLNRIYKEKHDVPKSIIYGMRSVKCEKIVEKEFEKENKIIIK